MRRIAWIRTRRALDSVLFLMVRVRDLAQAAMQDKCWRDSPTRHLIGGSRELKQPHTAAVIRSM